MWNYVHGRSPELRLWASVLIEALRPLYVGTTDAVLADTLLWVSAEPTRDIGDFANICLQLELEADDVMRSLRRHYPRFLFGKTRYQRLHRPIR